MARRSAAAVDFRSARATFYAQSSTTPTLHVVSASSQEEALADSAASKKKVTRLFWWASWWPNGQSQGYDKVVFDRQRFSVPRAGSAVSDGAREAGVAVLTDSISRVTHRGEGGRPVYRQDSRRDSSSTKGSTSIELPKWSRAVVASDSVTIVVVGDGKDRWVRSGKGQRGPRRPSAKGWNKAKEEHGHPVALTQGTIPFGSSGEIPAAGKVMLRRAAQGTGLIAAAPCARCWRRSGAELF